MDITTGLVGGLAGAGDTRGAGGFGSAALTQTPAAQEFLNNRLNAIKNLFTKGEGLEDIAIAKAHPVFGVINYGSKALGGPSLREGFSEGVTSLDPTKSKGYAINLPPMRF